MLGRIGQFLKGIVAAKPIRSGPGPVAGAAKQAPPQPRAGIAAQQGDVVVRSGDQVAATPISIPGPPPKAGSLVGGPVPHADLEAIRRPGERGGEHGASGTALDPGRRLHPHDPEIRAKPHGPERGRRSFDPGRGP